MSLGSFPPTPYVFGTHPCDVVPQAWNFLGMPGWFRVPLGWFARQNQDGTITASPNSDYSAPTYDCQVNIDGYMVFFTLGNPNPLSSGRTSTAFNPLPIQVTNGQLIARIAAGGAIIEQQYKDTATGKIVDVSVNNGQ